VYDIEVNSADVEVASRANTNIRNAYRKASLFNHPDKLAIRPPDFQPVPQQLLNYARDILVDAKKHVIYYLALQREGPQIAALRVGYKYGGRRLFRRW
jgi:DnaJ-class molecular chaperone